MFQAKKINKRIAVLAKSLKGRNEISKNDFADLIYKALKPLGIKVELTEVDIGVDILTVGGYFEPERVRQPMTVEVHTSKDAKTLMLDDLDMDAVYFILFQTICHEMIHKYQYQHRDGEDVVWYYEMDDRSLELSEHQMYFAEVDEIDTYGHDIALELCYYYPETAFDVMKNITEEDEFKEITSWHIYTEAFAGQGWSDIRKRLLKKSYLHLVNIIANKEQYHA
jgi:hypothetical protein